MSDIKQSREKIGSDKWLRVLMKAGIPLAIISLVSLWLGHLMANPVFGKLFLVTLPVTLLIGFAYNIRYVMLAIRKQRQSSADE